MRMKLLSIDLYDRDNLEVAIQATTSLKKQMQLQHEDSSHILHSKISTLLGISITTNLNYQPNLGWYKIRE